MPAAGAADLVRRMAGLRAVGILPISSPPSSLGEAWPPSALAVLVM